MTALFGFWRKTNLLLPFRAVFVNKEALSIIQSASRHLYAKEHVVSVFFDLESAYDTTWKYGIMNDLHDFGMIGRLAYFISVFLNERQVRARVGDTLSNSHEQEMGVPQGSILSVTLFSVKINNIVKSVFPGVECFLCVDDFCICYRSKHIHTIERQLQQVLNNLKSQ